MTRHDRSQPAGTRPTDLQPEEVTDSTAEPKAADTRGKTTTQADRSAHRRHQWLYEDLLA